MQECWLDSPKDAIVENCMSRCISFIVLTIAINNYVRIDLFSKHLLKVNLVRSSFDTFDR